MAFKITNDCNSCGACEPECPNDAISQGDDVYVVNEDHCTECVGFHAEPQCAAACPVDACLVDDDRVESDAQLIARARELHPDKDFGCGYPTRFG